MKSIRIIVFQQITIWFFSFAIIIHTGVEAPVLCLEADGHVNIESKCDSDCEVPVDSEHQDDCGECVDVQLWDTNSNTPFLHSSVNFDIGFDYIFSDQNLFDVFHQVSFFSPTKENPNNHFPLFLKNTILLI